MMISNTVYKCNRMMNKYKVNTIAQGGGLAQTELSKYVITFKCMFYIMLIYLTINLIF